MRRGSIIGPIILILIGSLFLANNLVPDLPLLRIVGEYWPFLLIGWGLLRLAEILYWAARSRPLPVHGLSGGEWVLIIFLCLIGSGIFYGYRYSRNWPQARITMHGLEVLGESYDFPLAEQKSAAGKTPRVLVENLRGNARIVGADTEEVKAGGRTTVRAFQQADAEKANNECPLEIVRQGDLVVVRSNHDKLTGSQRISSDLEITVPRGASVQARGRYGDFDVSELGGSIDINSDNAGVRLSNIGGSVRVDLRKSDIVRAVNVKGSVEVKGGGWDVELENIEGQATVNGSYSGELIFRNVAKGFRFDSSSTELRVERLPGQLRMSRGDMSASGLTGPVQLKARSKDLVISDFTDSVEISVERGDIELRPGKLPLAKMEVRTRSGDVRLSVPPAARFEIRAATTRGDIQNDYGSPLRVEPQGRGATLAGSVGEGPVISLNTDRGVISVRKSSVETSSEPKAAPAPKAPSSLPVEQQ